MLATTNRPSRRVAWAVAAILALTASGCSDGKGADSKPRERPGDEVAIRNVLVTTFKTIQPERFCSRALTRHLLRQIYESRAACVRVATEEEKEEDEPVKRVEVSGIDVDDRRARARARLIGGDGGGTAGIVSLAREDGAWRIDELSVGFLRSALRSGLAHEKDVRRSVTRCVDKRLMRMPDGRFMDFAYGSLGKRPDAQRLLLAVLTACERAEGRTSSIRKELEKEIAKSLRQSGAKRGVITCVIRRLTRSLPDKKLIELTGAELADRRARLRRIVVAAVSACRGSDLGPGGTIS